MRRLLIPLLIASPSAPALAQHQGHNMPAPAAPADPHAGHAMPAPAAPADPHAGHAMPAPAVQADPHAGHQMSDAPAVADPPVAPPPSPALSGPVHAADSVYPAGTMDEARGIFRREHGAIRTHRLLIDQLETRIRNGRDGYAWDAEAWYGGALDRVWLKTEGEGEYGERPERAEVQVLWSRALDPWFNLQAGVRYDFRPDPERGYLVLGIEGLAPYWFDVDGALFLSDRGHVSARFEGEYDLRITQRLILQPRLELDFALRSDRAIGVGSGLSSAEAGLRLRYEIVPEFAPYVGVQYGRAFGNTADFRRAAGEDVGGWSLLLGVRTWF
jgi:copper resistance protein B